MVDVWIRQEEEGTKGVDMKEEWDEWEGEEGSLRVVSGRPGMMASGGAEEGLTGKIQAAIAKGH